MSKKEKISDVTLLTGAIKEKVSKEEISDTMLLADALLRLKAMENLLIAKGLFTREEFSKEMEAITIAIAKNLLERANVGGDIDAIIQEVIANTSKQN